MPPPRLGTRAPHCCGVPSLSLSGELPSASKFAFAQSPARRPRPATCTPRPRTPQARGWAPARWSAGTRGLRLFFFFFKQKALAARYPLLPGPRHLSFMPTPHLPGTHAARCLSRQTMGSELARQPAPSPRPHPRIPRELSAGAERGAERSEAGEATMGKVGASPWDSRLAPGAGRRGGVGVSCAVRPGAPRQTDPAAHSPARWQIVPPVHRARASAASKARCAP